MKPNDSSRASSVPPRKTPPAMAGGDASASGSGAGDIRRLAAHSPGIDASAYFDCQEPVALAAAVAAWPFLASLLDVGGKGADLLSVEGADTRDGTLTSGT